MPQQTIADADGTTSSRKLLAKVEEEALEEADQGIGVGASAQMATMGDQEREAEAGRRESEDRVTGADEGQDERVQGHTEVLKGEDSHYHNNPMQEDDMVGEEHGQEAVAGGDSAQGDNSQEQETAGLSRPEQRELENPPDSQDSQVDIDWEAALTQVSEVGIINVTYRLKPGSMAVLFALDVTFSEPLLEALEHLGIGVEKREHPEDAGETGVEHVAQHLRRLLQEDEEVLGATLVGDRKEVNGVQQQAEPSEGNGDTQETALSHAVSEQALEGEAGTANKGREAFDGDKEQEEDDPESSRQEISQQVADTEKEEITEARISNSNALDGKSAAGTVNRGHPPGPGHEVGSSTRLKHGSPFLLPTKSGNSLPEDIQLEIRTGLEGVSSSYEAVDFNAFGTVWPGRQVRGGTADIASILR